MFEKWNEMLIDSHDLLKPRLVTLYKVTNRGVLIMSVIEIKGTILRTVLGDISKIGTMDAIVNTANSHLNEHNGGVNISIHKTAGPSLLQECKKLNGCEKGKAVITGAYQIHAKYIIHTVCPAWNNSNGNAAKTLSQCYKSSLDVAAAKKVHKIAFPLIGAGDLSFPLKDAARIAVNSVADYLKEHAFQFDEIVWVLFDRASKKCMDEVLLERTNRLRTDESKNVKNKAVSIIENDSSAMKLSKTNIAGKGIVQLGGKQVTQNAAKTLNNGTTGVQKKATQSIAHKDNEISAKDFVVRRAVFKCRYNNHSLKDVQAVFTTISRLGTVDKIRIPAGYCPNCNTYFIMESTYQRIKRSGIPICRTMDEKTYIQNNVGNGMSSYSSLAQESVLKQFGYSVSQVDDLPLKQRRLILAALVDNNVLTKNDVIGYLDYFINSRKNQKNADGSKKYSIAISRWEEDRDFIRNYKTGTFKEVRIQRIITNK